MRIIQNDRTLRVLDLCGGEIRVDNSEVINVAAMILGRAPLHSFLHAREEDLEIIHAANIVASRARENTMNNKKREVSTEVSKTRYTCHACRIKRTAGDSVVNIKYDGVVVRRVCVPCWERDEGNEQ